MKTLDSLLVNNPIYEQYRNILSKLNKTVISLIQDSNYQSKNMFEFFLYPYDDFSLNVEAFEQIAQIAVDTAIIKTQLASIGNIPSPKTESEIAGYEKYTSNLIPPDEMSITFYETELGEVFNWLGLWKSQIYKPHPVFKRIFNPNQTISKRNGFLTMHSKTGLPVPYVWKFKGLKFKNFEDFGIGHEDTEILTVTATFDVEDVELVTLSEFISSLL